MRKFNRRAILSAITAALPTLLIDKARSATTTTSLGFYVCTSAELKVGLSAIFSGQTADGTRIALSLFRTKTGLYAVDAVCTHQGCVVKGTGSLLVCPCHQSAFSAQTGAVMQGPGGGPKSSIKPLVKYKVTEKAGKVYVKGK